MSWTDKLFVFAMEKEELLSDDNAQSHGSFPGSRVSSRDVSLGSSNIMNVSSLRDSLNTSNDLDIKKKEITRKPKTIRPQELLGRELRTPFSSILKRERNKEEATPDEKSPYLNSLFQKVMASDV